MSIRERLSGNEASATAMKQINPDVVAAFPITPSTEIPQYFSTFVANGTVDTEFVAVESEHSAMSACIGAEAAGSRAMTATSANGLSLMWEMIYIASSLRLPIVMSLVNRAVSGPLNIHNDHSDAMGVRDAGWIMMFSENNQEAYDNLLMAHRIAEHKDVMLPLMVCQDGFITSHSIENIMLEEDSEVKKFVGTYNPEHYLLNRKEPIAVGPLDVQPYLFEHKAQQADAMRASKQVILDVAKDLVSNKKVYSQDQYNFAPNKANQLYLGGQAAILYDNYSLANYIKLRKLFKASQKYVDLDDGTAFLKIKGPDGKFALEGTENWFSMTMFNADISDKKQEKILDILDYLLTEEGTRLAIYGKEGYDYSIVDGKVVLSEMGWEKDSMTGQYATKTNGAKYLRYMATLGNDTKSFDPFTEQDAYQLLTKWQEEMKKAKNEGNLRVVKEPADISWMSTPTKNDKTEGLLNDANTAVLKYCFNKIDLDAYKKEFENNNWKKVLQEINAKLGK